jgi:hypothetical protein
VDEEEEEQARKRRRGRRRRRKRRGRMRTSSSHILHFVVGFRGCEYEMSVSRVESRTTNYRTSAVT